MTAETSREIPGPATTTARLPLTRGRRAALAIGVPVCLLLIAYTALDLVALFGQGRFPVNYSAGAVKSLTVTSSGGQLLINGSTGQAATLTGTGDYSLIRPTVTERSTAGRASVRYHCGFPVGNCGLHATIEAPATVPVSVSTDGGNADIISTAGPVSLSTGGGDIDASDPSGPLSLNTSGGNVLLAHVESATVTATSGGGDVEVYFSRVPRDVRVQTSGGNITLVLPRGTTQYNISAHSDGGTVSNTIPQDSSSLNVITAATGGGNVTISEQ
jgi:Putative adhesin